MNRLQTLQKRAAALMPAPPWTFAEFAAAWPAMDALSRSLYEYYAGLNDGDGPLYRDYLTRLGVTVERQQINVELEGDTP